MIVRRWRGTARGAQNAAAYERHIRETVFPKLPAIPGFVRAELLKRSAGEEVHFEALTTWRRIEDIRGFAGEDYARAVVEPEARRVLSRFDEHAEHFEVAVEASGPAKGYWIGRVDVHDVEAYRAYLEANGPLFREHHGRFLVRGGRYEAVEGSARSRNVVLEFPSFEAALSCWRSPEYQAILPLRTRASTADLIVIEGYAQK